mmetsp:Transcript_19271/g.44082  ORF Transcript_19271/g.44082 Transcript_19271/m.44082 type:complete len:87 (-) Transcript_19271:189-449(-)
MHPCGCRRTTRALRGNTTGLDRVSGNCEPPGSLAIGLEMKQSKNSCHSAQPRCRKVSIILGCVQKFKTASIKTEHHSDFLAKAKKS